MKLNNNDDSHNSGLNLLIYNMLLDIESHPAWVCGLKQRFKTTTDKEEKSHPAWVCGLKQRPGNCERKTDRVTPCVGVWIETLMLAELVKSKASHPAWVCGLKQKVAFQRLYKSSHTLRGCVD